MNEPNQFDFRQRHAGVGPLLIGGACAGLVLAFRTPLVAFVRGFFSGPPEPRRSGGTALLDRGLPLELIRDAILGRGKSAIAAVFGAPRTAAGNARFPRPARPDFWSADTWYYPIDTERQTAMAVRFDHGIARGVEFFQAPLGHGG
jgi:hypothetical protein